MIHETAILAMCLNEPDIWHKANLKEAYFESPLTRAVYVAMRSALQRHGYIALESVRENLPSQYSVDELIRDYEDIPVPSQWEYYRDMIVRKYKQRELRRLAMEIREEIETGDPDPNETAVTLIETARDIQVDGPGSKIYSFNEITRDAISELERRKALGGEYPGIPMHVHDIDKAFKGFQPGMLYYVGARTSAGKSALVLQILHNIAKQEIPVGMLSLESSRKEIAIRMFHQAAGLDPDRVAIGTLSATEYADLNDSITRRKDMPFFIDDTENASISHVQQTARLMKSKYNIQALAVDYVQIIRGDRKIDRHLEVAQNSIALKNLARELDIPIIAAAQLKREDGKRPGLESFADSDQIPRDADGVILLHWKGRDDHGGDVTGIVAKNRDGWVGDIDLRFVAKRMSFTIQPKTDDTP